MNKDKAGELLGKFWEEMPDSEVIDSAVYVIDTFLEWLYNEGYEICLREFVSNGVDKYEYKATKNEAIPKTKRKINELLGKQGKDDGR